MDGIVPEIRFKTRSPWILDEGTPVFLEADTVIISTERFKELLAKEALLDCGVTEYL